MTKAVLVTGATGNVGKQVVRALKEQGIFAKRCVSQAHAGQSLADDAVVFDFRDRNTWPKAVENVDALFLLRPPSISDVARTLNPFFDFAVQRGIQHTVFLSVMGAGSNSLVPHHKVENHLLASGASHTFLRPGFFAQNLGDAYRADIVRDHRLYVPAGRGRVAFVDLRDVADVAALAFCSPAQYHAAFELTGPQAYTFDEAARLLTDALGRNIVYRPASILGYAHHLRRRGLAPAHILVQTILHVGLRFGQAETIDPTLQKLLGRPGHSLEQYIRDHDALFQNL